MNTGARRNIQLGGQKDGKKGRKKREEGRFLGQGKEQDIWVGSIGYPGWEDRIFRLGRHNIQVGYTIFPGLEDNITSLGGHDVLVWRAGYPGCKDRRKDMRYEV